MTLPEVKLWQALRTRPAGLKFRRQHPAGRYVLDFFCADRTFAVEVDGEVHGLGDRPTRDAERDAWLSARGVAVYRVPARAVLDDVEGVVRHVTDRALARAPLHQPAAGPPPLAGEGR